jgi:pimeloyl-ACP methyl ester carboxylesterase
MVPFSPDPELERALWGFLQQPSHDTHEILWDRCTFDLEAVKRRLGEAWAPLVAYNVGRARDPRLGAAQRALMEAFGFPAIDASELARIETPTTLIWGRHDRAARLVVAETASARYRWPLQVIEHAAADPHLEQPEAFLEALEALEAAQARTGDAQPAGSAR